MKKLFLTLALLVTGSSFGLPIGQMKEGIMQERAQNLPSDQKQAIIQKWEQVKELACAKLDSQLNETVENRKEKIKSKVKDLVTQVRPELSHEQKDDLANIVTDKLKDARETVCAQ